MMVDFWHAVYLACNANSILVGLTEHMPNGIPKRMNIRRRGSRKGATYPCLLYGSDEDSPAIKNSLTSYKRTVVEFECQAKKELDSMKIADCLELMIHKKDQPQNQYWNISTLKILNRGTIFLSRSNAEYDSQTDIWNTKILVDFRWSLI